MPNSYPIIEQQIRADFQRGAITRDEKHDLLARVRKAESRREAQTIVDKHRVGRA